MMKVTLRGIGSPGRGSIPMQLLHLKPNYVGSHLLIFKREVVGEVNIFGEWCLYR